MHEWFHLQDKSLYKKKRFNNNTKYYKLVYPVNNKGGAPIMHPDGADNCQEQGEARREEAQHLITETHSLSCGQRRIPQLENAVAGSKRLF